jgi:hypothetical protein
MSWLFDRLCEVAIADRVSVVLAATPDVSAGSDEAGDLVEVMLRVARVPQLSLTLLPEGVGAPVELGPVVRSIDVEDGDPATSLSRVAELLDEQRSSTGLVLVVRGTVVGLHQVGSEASSNEDVLMVYATDRADEAGLLRSAGVRGLSIAIGGLDPDAQVKVESFLGVVSIVDALVTLRMFAFGGGRDSSDPSSAEDRDSGTTDLSERMRRREYAGASPALRRVV